ncbi:MAG: T9SS type A sorting domain-containing protein [Chitinophagales bacterium]|nr:T9SS type A sorting domain-containing protein [Chitinophagales bacterium]
MFLYNYPFDNLIKFTYISNINTKVKITLISSDGKLIYNTISYIQNGQNLLQISDLNSLSKGNYFLSLFTDTEVNTIQLFKN